MPSKNLVLVQIANEGGQRGKQQALFPAELNESAYRDGAGEIHTRSLTAEWLTTELMRDGERRSPGIPATSRRCYFVSMIREIGAVPP